MALVTRLYRWLARVQNPGCDRILGAALERAEEPWFGKLVEALLERNTDSSWAELVGQYSRIAPDVKARLAADPERRRTAIALAMKFDSATARMNAVAAVEEELNARMAYLLPDGLRDPSSEVRTNAVKLLRKLAEEALPMGAVAPPADDAAREKQAEDRKAVSAAANQAFHAFDVHHRSEAVEIGLWFITDHAAAMWEHIETTRSRIGVVINEHLHEWDSPRNAAFLLLGLRRDAWRARCAEILTGWNTPMHVCELLRCTHLLDDPDIARNLATVRARHWFNHTGKDSPIPSDLLLHLPRWIRYVGMTDAERVALLNRFLVATEDAMHRTAIYALADMACDDARDALKQVAEGRSPLARFARWVSLARDAGLVRAAETHAQQQQAQRQARYEAPPASESDRDFILLWQVCRRTDPTQRGELIASLRENADVWRGRLRMHLQSPDARDRTLALQIISTPKLALQFRRELQAMTEDQVEAIGRLAHALLNSVRHQSPIPEDDSAAPPEPMPQRGDARQELRDMLEKLTKSGATIADADTLKQVRSLLQEVYPSSEAQTTGAAS